MHVLGLGNPEVVNSHAGQIGLVHGYVQRKDLPPDLVEAFDHYSGGGKSKTGLERLANYLLEKLEEKGMPKVAETTERATVDCYLH